MPELPDVTVYVDRLAARVVGHRLERRAASATRSCCAPPSPPLASAEGRQASTASSALGKRIVLALEGDLFVVIHLMIAGRLRWLAPGKSTARNALALLRVRRRHAGAHRSGQQAARVAARGAGPRRAGRRSTPGGIDVLAATREAFAARLSRRTTRSSARSPIRASSAASATPTPTRSCIARGCRRSRLTRALDADADRAPLRRDAVDAARLDRALGARSRRRGRRR